MDIVVQVEEIMECGTTTITQKHRKFHEEQGVPTTGPSVGHTPFLATSITPVHHYKIQVNFSKLKTQCTTICVGE